MLTREFIDGLPGDGRFYRDDKVSSLMIRDGAKVKAWYWVAKKNGKAKWVKLGVWPTMGIAAARNAAKQEAAGTAPAPKYNPTLQDVFNRWADTQEGVKRSLAEDRRKMRTDLAALAGYPIQDITAARLRVLKDNMNATPVAFNRCLALLRSLFNFARRKMEIDVDNITEAIDRYQEQPRREKIPIEKAPAFLAALQAPGVDQDVSDIITILLFCGQRKSNTFSMRYSELDLKSGIWTIPAEKSKNKKAMIVPLPPEVLQVLRRRYRDRDQRRFTDWVFPQKRVARLSDTPEQAELGHIQDIRKSFAHICRQIGQPELTLHDLRRTFGTWMLNAGASIEQVAAALHHSSIRITESVYAEVMTKTVRQGVDLMRAAISEQAQFAEKAPKKM